MCLDREIGTIQGRGINKGKERERKGVNEQIITSLTAHRWESTNSLPGRNPILLSSTIMNQKLCYFIGNMADLPGEPLSQRCASAAPHVAFLHTGYTASWSSLSSPRHWLLGKTLPAKRLISEGWLSRVPGYQPLLLCLYPVQTHRGVKPMYQGSAIDRGSRNWWGKRRWKEKGEQVHRK